MGDAAQPPAGERERTEASADWYLSDQTDIDRKLVEFSYETVRGLITPRRVLELGSGSGDMTALLVHDVEQLTVVDASPTLLAAIPDAPNLTKAESLFEEYEPEAPFEAVLLLHVLEHVDDPVALLRRASSWVVPDGRIVVGVPNGHSLHRLAAVRMGLIDDPCALGERDLRVGHRRVYTPELLAEHVEAAGLEPTARLGAFVKPLPNEQIDGVWTDAQVRAFFELGWDFPELAAELLMAARPANAK